jgi:hypothetical protein
VAIGNDEMDVDEARSLAAIAKSELRSAERTLHRARTALAALERLLDAETTDTRGGTPNVGTDRTREPATRRRETALV